MIAGVHKIRTVVILGMLLVGAIAALYYGVQWFGRELRDKPYVANVKSQLRSLAAAQEAFRRDSLAYTSEVARVWHPSAETQGIEIRILEAGADRILAEGRRGGRGGRRGHAGGPPSRGQPAPGGAGCPPGRSRGTNIH